MRVVNFGAVNVSQSVEVDISGEDCPAARPVPRHLQLNIVVNFGVVNVSQSVEVDILVKIVLHAPSPVTGT